MKSNKTILEKADLSIGDLTTDGGVLVDAQSQKFIEHMIEESVMLKEVKVVPMKSKKQLVEGLHFTSRVLRAATSGQALSLAQRSKPTTTKEELDSVLVKAQVTLNDEVLEDNIEQGTLKNTVMRLLTERMGVDLDELIIQGDTASADTLLALFDGWLKSTTSHIVDAGTTPLSDLHLRSLLKAIPKAALRKKMDLKFYTSVDADIDYKHALSQRGDALGVSTHQEDKPVQYQGVKIMPVHLFPENLGVGTNETNVILANGTNWNHGIWRQIKIETQRDALSGEFHVVASLRIAGTWALEDHTAKATKIKVS